ncbi:YhdP family protein [Thalassococcus lentus]|uniref:DUF3971 domain-containing protein n=1 Tax=Thalassococcus lentus TaxID=1210524 RepID=A0ABT4XVI7_9RHOB|nr:AsmA-like C-terminal region-containing protein [Thalassococcus lentus]MDA7425980.1 DUF3971 domain-containing protein [Thalassococcus lentus]
MSEGDKIEKSQPERRKRRGGLVVLAVFAALCLAIAGGAFAIMGRTLDAPVWLRERIEARLAQDLPGMRVAFGRMSVQVDSLALSRIILWDVRLDTQEGLPVAALSDFEAGFNTLSLLRRSPELKTAQISGAFVTVTRDAGGKLGLALGDAFAVGSNSPGIPDMISIVDQAFADPRLAGLKSVDADALTIRFEDQRARRGWTVDGGRLKITRSGNTLDLFGDFALLSGGAGVASIELNASSPIGGTSVDFGVSLRDLAAKDIASQSPALAWLEAIDAPISGALRSRLDDDGRLGPLNATLQIAGGVLQPNAQTKPVPFDSARAYFTYVPDLGQLRFDEISVTSPLGRVSADGTAKLEGLDQGWPTALLGQVRLSQIALSKGTLLDRDFALKGADMDFKLLLRPFEVKLGQLSLSDPDLPLRASGRLVARPDGWQLALDATARETNPEQVMSFWPEDLKPKPRKWVSEHVLGGTLSDVIFSLRAEPGEKPVTYLDFAFDDGHVLYNKKLPPVRNGKGRLSIFDNRLGLRLEKGTITPATGGTIDVAGSEFVMTEINKPGGPGEVKLKARGPVKAALSYIDNDAWRVLAKVKRTPDIANGVAEVTGRIALPLRRGVKLSEIALDLKGTARDVTSAVVPGRDLTSQELAFAVTNSQLVIDGPVTLSGVRAKGQWVQPFNGKAGQITADLQIDQKGLAAFGVDLPDGFLTGSGSGRLTVDLVKNSAPQFAVQSGLAGIGLAIPQLGWRLSKAAKGSFRVAGSLSEPAQIDALSLSAGGLDAKGKLSLAANGGFEELRLDTVKLGGWLDVTGRLRGRGKGQAPAVEVSGGSVDLRRAAFGGGSGSGDGSASGAGVPLNISLDRLRVTDSIDLQRFAGEFVAGAGMEGRFSALLGDAPITGRVLPQNGRSAFRVRGEDAGDILKAAGLIKTVQNGTFKLDLAPVRGTTGSYDGDLTIEGARLRNAPAIGALLDAISIVGLIDQLNGPGIFFAEVDARFRLTPNRVVLTRSSAVGPSMGISMDGYYDMASGQMDMQGVLSPIYILNGIGRLISRKGEGLIGFNFNLRGPIAQPQVTVNPLSVFTPGMFRDIFRRPPPQVSQ